jgi:hypothetical protein
MTIHAQAGGRNTRVFAFVRANVAVDTRDLQLPRVQCVGKSNWLHRFIALLVARPIEGLESGDQKDRTANDRDK